MDVKTHKFKFVLVLSNSSVGTFFFDSNLRVLQFQYVCGTSIS